MNLTIKPHDCLNKHNYYFISRFENNKQQINKHLIF
jgi:hypothetical protein